MRRKRLKLVPGSDFEVFTRLYSSGQCSGPLPSDAQVLVFPGNVAPKTQQLCAGVSVRGDVCAAGAELG